MNLNTDSEWLRKMAEKEDGGIISVGGLVHTIKEREQAELIAAAQEAADALYNALWQRPETENLPNCVRGDAWPALDRLRAALAAMGEGEWNPDRDAQWGTGL